MRVRPRRRCVLWWPGWVDLLVCTHAKTWHAPRAAVREGPKHEANPKQGGARRPGGLAAAPARPLPQDASARVGAGILPGRR